MLTKILRFLVADLDEEIARLTQRRADLAALIPAEEAPKRRGPRTAAAKAEVSRKMKAAWARRKQKAKPAPADAADTTH